MPSGNDIFAASHRLAIELGPVFGILSMFFFSANTEGIRHPNAEDRLTNILETLTSESDPFAWGIACVGLQMWDEQFGLDLSWMKPITNYKDQYYDIIKQIKERK